MVLVLVLESEVLVLGTQVLVLVLGEKSLLTSLLKLVYVGVDVVRRSLPECWRGLRDEVLSQKSGIDGCVFVHASGFIGGNRTYEGALLMARHALQM